MRVRITGDRRFQNYEAFRKQCSYVLKNQTSILVLAGGAPGPDRMAERFCKERNLFLERHIADFELLKEKAEELRNEEMAQIADACIVFHHPSSRNSTTMIASAKRHNLKLRVIDVTRL